MSRIKEVWFCWEEDKPVNRNSLVKGYEYQKGEYVVVTEDELKAVAPPTATIMEILQFVQSDEVDPIYLESSYYIAPEETVSKPYILLWDALAETKYYAVAKVAMHNREHIVIIRPTKRGMVLHTMYYANELHEANALRRTSKAEHNAKEMALAKNLIETLAGPFKPAEFHDQYRENVEDLIEKKRKGQKVTAVKRPSKKAPVVNIMTALQRSLEQSRKAKPAGTAVRARHSAKKRSRSAA